MASATTSTFYGNPVLLAPSASGSSALTPSRTNHCSLNVRSASSMHERISEKLENVPRRSFAVAGVLAFLLESYSLQEAHAARMKKEEEKKPLVEEKGLSAYDAKLLANNRRKEAMKEAMAKQKARAKSTKSTPSTSSEPNPIVKTETEAPAAPVASTIPEKQAVPVTESAPAAPETTVPTPTAEVSVPTPE